MTLQEIQDGIAKEKGYDHWERMIHKYQSLGALSEIHESWRKVVNRAQWECGKLTLEKASENALITEFQDQRDYSVKTWVDKSSITDEKNIVIID